MPNVDVESCIADGVKAHQDPSQLCHIQAITKLIQAAGFLSGCGLDVCVAVAAPKQIQLWASRNWRGDFKDTVRKLTNVQADLDKGNMDLDMFVSLQSESEPTLCREEEDTSSSPSTLAQVRDGDETSKSCVMEAGNIKCEPLVVDWIKREVEDSSYMEEGQNCCGDKELNAEYCVEIGSQSDDGQIQIHIEAGCTLKDDAVLDIRNKSDPVPEPVSAPRNRLQITRGSNAHYNCTECGYTTDWNGNFRRHLRRHTGERPYKCKFCNYAVKHWGSLNRHLKLHAGDKPYACELCDYRAVQAFNLRQHMKTHNRFKCEFCNFTSTQSCYLSSHMMSHNAGDTSM